MSFTSGAIPDDVRQHYETICAHPDFRRAEERRRLLWHLLLQTYSVIAPTDSGIALAASFYGQTDDEQQQEKDHSKIRQAVPKLSLALAAYYRRVPQEAIEFIIVAGRNLEVVRHDTFGGKPSPSEAAKLDSGGIPLEGHTIFEEKAISRIAEEIGELRTLVEERLSDVVLRAVHEALLAKWEAPKKLEPSAGGPHGPGMELEEWKSLYRRAVVELEPRSAKRLVAGDLAGAARIRDRLTNKGSLDPAERARDLFELGLIYRLQFNYAQALEALRESWNLTKKPSYGIEFAACAQHQQHIDEAIAVYEAIKPSFADLDTRSLILNNLAGLYIDTQRTREAEVAYGQAIAILRPLAKTPYYLPRLATATTNLGWLYCKAQRMEEAGELLRQAIVIVRTLRRLAWHVDVNLAATILHNLATFYHQTDRRKEAEELYRQSIGTSQKAVQSDPVTASHRMARALFGLAHFYFNARRVEEAEARCLEAVTIRRQLASNNMDAYSRELAETLILLGKVYTYLGRLSEANTVFQEADGICKTLETTYSQVNVPLRAHLLYHLGILYRKMRQTGKAQAAYGEALAIFTRLEASSGCYLEFVAATLNHLALLHSETQTLSAAEIRHQEATSIYRLLVRSNPTTQLSGLANSLTNLSLVQSDMHKLLEADAAYQEAYEIYQELAKRNPGIYLPQLGGMLVRCANRYYSSGQFSKVESSLREALIIGRRLAMIDADIYLPYLSNALSLFGAVCLRMQRLGEAETALSDCLAMDRKLSDASPSPNRLTSLAHGLTNIGLLYKITGRMDSAKAAFEESASIYRRLLESNPDSCLPRLAGTLGLLAEVHEVVANVKQADDIRREQQMIQLMLAATAQRD